MQAITPTKKLTAMDIYGALNYTYAQNSFIKVSNVYLYNWESDFIVVKSSNHVYEFEIKTSRSDFYADFKKKDKHDVLSKGFYNSKYNPDKDVVGKRPNKFYYVCPEGMINKAEVPEYAGLLYVVPSAGEGHYRTIKVKEAKKIHSELFCDWKLLSLRLYARSNDNFSTAINAVRSQKIYYDELYRLKNNCNIPDEIKKEISLTLHHY